MAVRLVLNASLNVFFLLGTKQLDSWCLASGNSGTANTLLIFQYISHSFQACRNSNSMHKHPLAKDIKYFLNAKPFIQWSYDKAGIHSLLILNNGKKKSHRRYPARIH